MAIANLSDDSVLTLYNSLREQALADVRTGSRYRFLGASARQQAQRLEEELERRWLPYTPIDWG